MILNFKTTINVLSISILLSTISPTVLSIESSQKMAQTYLSRTKKHLKDGDEDLARADFEKVRLFDAQLARENEFIFFDRDAQKWIKKGDDAFFAKEKIRCYKKALRSSPKNIEAHLKLAKAQLKGKQYGSSLSTYESILILDPMNKKAKKGLKRAKKMSKKEAEKKQKRKEKEQKRIQKNREKNQKLKMTTEADIDAPPQSFPEEKTELPDQFINSDSLFS